ncbi:beta-ketoacyl synthase N-terminal-like domain-containing protein [Streptomyces sp. NPDC048278]|uniref:beta-ketoacyl synthase N-terminal-like domain-containing protein n=1 Tax=Streptomyces sp. NPDC048278 TaxID=3155809 RepID=UPI003422AA45
MAASVLHPAAGTLADLDTLLRRSRSALSAVPLDREGNTTVPAALLRGPDVRQWAADRAWLDPADTRRLMRVCARATLPVWTACCTALETVTRAALTPAERGRTAVVVAGNNLALAQHARTAVAYAEAPETTPAGHLLDLFDTDVLGAVGEVTGCTGEGWQIGGSSAAGTLALIHADRMIRGGCAERCLVVAPVTDLAATDMGAFVRSGAMVRLAAGDDAALACRPFDVARRGFAPAHMAAAVLLETDGAVPRRGRRLGLLLGHGVTTDGRRGTGPDPDGQAAAMAAALERARLPGTAVDYVSAHATGSVAGDSSEATAIRRVLGSPGGGPLVNATKAVTGHGLAAAGLVEAIATLLQLRGGYCHATPNLDSPLEPALRHVIGEARSAPLRVAVSNSFAFGGLNASLVLALTPRSELP